MRWYEKLFNAALSRHSWAFWAYGTFLCLVSALMIIKNKAIYISVWTHDNFTYLDGAYRILKGQTPHVDFVTPIGLFGYLFPYIGLKITGSYSLALPVSDLIVTVLFMVLAIFAARKRLSLLPGLLLLTYVWILVSVPINAGDTAQFISYSMFYNRYGWALLLVLYVLYVEDNKGDLKDTILDIIAVSTILIFLFYTKISYFAVSLAFLPILALKTKYHFKIAIICFVNLLLGVLCVELVWPGLTMGYFHDLLTALQASGAIRDGVYNAINFIYRNIADIILVVFIVTLSARAKTMGWLDYIFVAYVFLATYALLNQNAQTRNMVTLFAISIWGMQITMAQLIEKVKVSGNEGLKISKAITFSVMALSVLMLSQPFATRAYGLAIIHARSKAMPASRPINLNKLNKIYVYRDKDYISGIDKDHYNNKELYVLRNRLRRDWLAEQEYVETVTDGVKLLTKHANSNDSIIVMDMVNPFNFIMDTIPPKNSYSFLHLHRTFNLGAARPGQSMLDHASLVMIPNYPIQMPELDALLEIFGPALKRKYKEVGRDRYWTLLRKMDIKQTPSKQSE